MHADLPGPGEAAAPAAASAGRPLEHLVDQHYDVLLDVARRELRRVGGTATLDTRAVLHETFLRLVTQRQKSWADEPRFMAAAAGMMRRVLIDHLRRRRAAMRGGGRANVTLDQQTPGVDLRDDGLLALDEALTRLGQLSPRLAHVVECRYFGGLTEAETATALGVTERTVRRDWVKARGWLHGALAGKP
jgi:RNA polymerase sigma factor (TIGR02999 family)